MGRVIVQEYVTLDGVAAGPGGELDFIAESTNVDSVDSEAARGPHWKHPCWWFRLPERTP